MTAGTLTTHQTVSPAAAAVAVVAAELQLYSVDALTGDNPQRLTVSADNRTGGMGGKPSPCGRYLAFASDRDLSLPQGLFDLYVLRLGPDGLPVSKNGQQVAPKRLTKGVANQFSRSWSPDSKRLVLNSQVSTVVTGNLATQTTAGKLSS
jgi:Tol biopolymer transport system component